MVDLRQQQYFVIKQQLHSIEIWLKKCKTERLKCDLNYDQKKIDSKKNVMSSCAIVLLPQTA